MHEKSKMKDIEEFKGVFINDFLCKESLELLNYAKSLKSVGFNFVYARGGNVFAKKDEKSRQILLRTMEDVDDQLCKSAGASRKRNLMTDIENYNEEDDDDDTQYESPN